MEPPRAGRNAPCPCGSGRKFKHCCLRQGVGANAPFASDLPGATPTAPPVPAAARGSQAKKQPARVSLCMIVKNEAANIPSCLASVEGLVNEIIVVDTGSTDGTKEVAAGLGAKVHDFPWVDDFAAARNESLRHARGEWVFWLDADDRVEGENRNKLADLFRSLPGKQAAYQMACDTFLAGVQARASHVRLFRPDSGGRWRYRVHEVIEWPPGVSTPPLLETDVAIRHVGYKDSEACRAKDERNLRLLQMEMQENPENVHVLLHLGRCYLGMQRFAEAQALLERCLPLTVRGTAASLWTYYSLLHAALGLGQLRTALDYCQRGLALYPNDPILRADEGKLKHHLHAGGGATIVSSRAATDLSPP